MECSVFQKAGFRADDNNFSGLVPLYSCITPLRFLCLRESRKDDWDVVDRFMDHDEDRERTDSRSWRIHELLVFNFISVVLKMADTFSKAEIRKSIGILRTNSVQIGSTVVSKSCSV